MSARAINCVRFPFTLIFVSMLKRNSKFNYYQYCSIKTSAARKLIDDDDIIRGGLAVAASGEFVLNFLAFVQGRQTCLFDRRNVDKSVL